MADVLEAEASTGTKTERRDRGNTETPKPLQDRGQGKPPTQVGLGQFESGSDVNVVSSGKNDFAFSASDNLENAILQTAETDLLSQLLPVLCFIASSRRIKDTLLAEIAERFLSRTLLIATQRVESSASTHARRGYDCFRSKLIAAVLDEPIEDGVTHPAEHVINEALSADSLGCQDWLSRVLVDHYSSRPSLCATIVRCIGRLDYGRVRGWGMRVVDDALQHTDAEVREAAIRALEAWGGLEGLSILRRHQDTEAWLNEYVRQIIVDLSGTTS